MRPYSAFKLFVKYLLYHFKAKTKHSVHSPFLFSFVTKCLEEPLTMDNTDLERLRSKLKRDSRELQFQDFGKDGQNTSRSIAQIARKSLKTKKYASLLAKISSYFNVNNALELGTSLGISSAYIARNISGQLNTFEGAQSIGQIAQENWSHLKIDNCNLINGSFENTVLKDLEISKQDLLFIDGHHQYKPTLTYFKHLLQYCSEDAVFVFDDIHWSADMEKAWEEIKTHDAVRSTIDLFFVGIVFLKKELQKEHFVIRY